MKKTHNGKPVGSPVENSAAYINLMAPQIAASRPHKSGPSTTGPCGPQQAAFRLILTLDNYPDEVTWNVKDSSGNILLSGGPYNRATQKGNIIDISTCLSDTASTFKIMDAAGDGVCCGYGQGGYQVYWNGALKKSGGSYGNSETTVFGGCSNYPNWMDAYGDGCAWYEANDDPGCPYYGNTYDGGQGLPNQACCHCGGGNVV